MAPSSYSNHFYRKNSTGSMIIVSLIYIIPLSISRSLFAEGSYSETELKVQFKKAIKIISLLLVPAILVTFLFRKYILLAFGKEYSDSFL
jgi:O-antigen/teichoic acid export membrane protein